LVLEGSKRPSSARLVLFTSRSFQTPDMLPPDAQALWKDHHRQANGHE
jgi:hypothetical protein